MRLATDQSGFTLAELMVATAIFSVILLVCAGAVLTVGRQFNKSSVSVSTQEAARTIMEEVSRQVQLGSDIPAVSTPAVQTFSGVDVQAFCIGAIRFSYAVGWQVNDTNDTAKHYILHGVWRDTIPTDTCSPADLTLSNPSDVDNDGSVDPGEAYNGKELLPKQVRLRSSIEPKRLLANSRVWRVNVAVAFGDDDLLQFGTPGDVTTIRGCSGGLSSGAVFCAASDLHTDVYRRFE